MAFISMIFASFIFIIILIIFVLFIISLIIFFVFAILSKKDKNKKSRKVLKIIFGVLTVMLFIPLLFVTIFLTQKTKETIHYNGKDYSVSKELVDKFYSKISCGDTESIDEYLEKNPELINSRTLEGSLPLGYAIKYKEIDSIKYFIEKNVDINTVSSNSEFGTLEYMFYYGYYDEDILNYILLQDNLDVNKRHLAMPVAQLYIKSIIKDKEISDTELEIFEMLLSKGLDLNATNGTDTNTYEYVKDSVSDDVVNVDKLRDMVENSKKECK